MSEKCQNLTQYPNERAVELEVPLELRDSHAPADHLPPSPFLLANGLRLQQSLGVNTIDMPHKRRMDRIADQFARAFPLLSYRGEDGNGAAHKMAP